MKFVLLSDPSIWSIDCGQLMEKGGIGFDVPFGPGRNERGNLEFFPASHFRRRLFGIQDGVVLELRPRGEPRIQVLVLPGFPQSEELLAGGGQEEGLEPVQELLVKSRALGQLRFSVALKLGNLAVVVGPLVFLLLLLLVNPLPPAS